MMAMYQEDARPLMEAMTQYEIMLQRETYLDFISTIGAIFKPGDPGNPMPMYELEENQNPASKANVRLSRVALDDTSKRRSPLPEDGKKNTAGGQANQQNDKMVEIEVQLLTSWSHTAAGCTIHFFCTTSQDQSSVKLLCLIDRIPFSSDVEPAIERCTTISYIEAMAMYQEDARPLMEAMTQYEKIIQQRSEIDFIRTIGAILKPGDLGNPMPMYELEENQNPASKATVRLTRLALDDSLKQ
eukprot:TRINITY_DN1227_c0_g1_i3.p1 TRINITY_DN1227_c0_g1~~TRINITY_DN1227_c0_g1_i3.p1  ORF type:complete len:243 (+),score=46.18 TRINITY_DN1227_c0_g1_i3:831-1559(+)